MNKHILKLFVVLILSLALFACKTTPNKYPTYQEAVANWKSYHDVADWLNNNFYFSWSRVSHAQKQGLVRQPKNLYNIKKGYCIDAALFAQRALNKINPEYKASLIYIDNLEPNQNDHWVTGFYEKGQLYVMDYGTGGGGWMSMRGVHGPYDSLDQYRNFLSTLSIKTFTVGEVVWNDLPYRFMED